MSFQRSASWLQIHRSHEQYLLSCTPRHSDLVDDLKHPNAQRPSLNIFIGKQAKDTALTRIFPQNAYRHGSRAQSINLSLDYTTQSSQAPILFADCDIEHSNYTQSRDKLSDGIGVRWAKGKDPMILSVILTRCLFNFADSIWIFAEDYGGMNGVKLMITHLRSIESRPAYPSSLKPRLVVIHNGRSSKSDTIEQETYEDLFSALDLLEAPSQGQSPRQYEDLRESLAKIVEVSQQKRVSSYLLFSAAHQQVLISEAIKHIADDKEGTFDIIDAARRRLSQTDMVPYIEDFLRLAEGARPTYSTLAIHLSSCFITDAYPPNMHAFGPRMLFKTIYSPSCILACRAVYGDCERAGMVCAEIERCFVQQASLIVHGQSALSVRKSATHNTGRFWTFASTHSCFSCFRRAPEHPLPCGHFVCDVCVETFGQSTIGSETNISLNECCICGNSASVIVNIKPKTAAPRILSIDGGGSRGVIPIESLLLLQESFGPECPVQDFFDFAIGTSAGGLIVLGLFLRGLSILHSKEIFKEMIRKFFEGKQSNDGSLLGQCRRLLRSALNDYVYDVKDLEAALVDLFGADTKMFGYSNLVRSGIKVAVTAATHNPPTARLFANYNGHEPFSTECGYQVDHADDPENEPRIWQTARATTAVPILFPSIDVPFLGSYWDGAFSRHNNPVNLALWESKRLWPENLVPDVVVSLGTGVKAKNQLEKKTMWNLVQGRGVPKLWTSLMFFLEGEEGWRDLTNSLDKKSKDDYFRFNVPIQGPPSLDDISAMDSLSASLRTVTEGGVGIRDALTALLVSCFYFELGHIPARHSQGLYYVSGYVKCRSDQPRNIIRTLCRLHSHEIRIFNGKKDLGFFLTENDVCSACLRYRSKIEILVRSLDEPLELLLSWHIDGKSNSRRLSSMPQSIAWFINRQGLNNLFGSSNHNLPGQINCPSCISPTPSRSVAEPYLRSRKRRLLPREGIARKKLAVRVLTPVHEEG